MRHVGLEEDGVPGAEHVVLGAHDHLQRAAGDDQILERARRVRVGVLDRERREVELVELDGARLIEGKSARDEKAPSCEVSTLWRAAAITVVRPAPRLVISAENGTARARAIFQSTLIVGVLCPSSICPSIARLTPEARARRSSERPRFMRRRRRLEPTTGVRSDEASADATS